MDNIGSNTNRRKNYFLAGGAPCSIGGEAAPMAKEGPGKKTSCKGILYQKKISIKPHFLGRNGVGVKVIWLRGAQNIKNVH